MKSITKFLLLIIANLFFYCANAQMLGSLDFNGDDTYVEVVNSPLNEIGEGNFTFELWIKGEELDQSAHPIIFSNRGSNAFGGGILLFFHNNFGGSQSKSICLQVDANNYLFVENGLFNGSLLDNVCHHIAVTREGNTLTFYVDGILIGSTSPADLGTISNNSSFWIGRDKSTNNTFDGVISQCRIWDIVKTESEINESKDLSLNGDENGLLAYWEMNDQDGQILLDKTGQFNGILGSSEEVDNQDPAWSDDGCVEKVSVSTNETAFPTFKITPNPASDFVSIQLQDVENVRIELLDQLGKVIQSKTVNTQTIDVDISYLPKGIYFLKMNCNNQIHTQKLVKN